MDLGAVAGGDDDRLADRRAGQQLGDELVRRRVGERDALAQLDGRRVVRDAEREDLAHTGSFSATGAGSCRGSVPRAASSLSSISWRSMRLSFSAMIEK